MRKEEEQTPQNISHTQKPPASFRYNLWTCYSACNKFRHSLQRKWNNSLEELTVLTPMEATTNYFLK